MSVTQHVKEYYSQSSAHIEYLKSINRLMDIEDEFDCTKELDGAHDELIKQYLMQLEKIRETHCRLNVGETMIRRMNEKYRQREQSMDRALHVKLFTNMAMNAGKVKYTEKNFAEIFRCVLEENKYPKYGRKNPINRDHVIEMCMSLGWNSDDVNYILLRCLDDDGLNYKSVDDLAAMFALDVPGADATHDRSIRQTVTRRKNAKNNETAVEKRNNKNVTTEMVNVFRKIIEDKKFSLNERKECYIDTLMEYKEFLDSPSETARQYFARILEFEYEDSQDMPVETALENWVFDENAPKMTKEEMKELKSWWVGHGPDEWSIPTVNYSKNAPALFRVSLYHRMQSILDGTLQVGKNDMLYALFYACVQCWERDKTTNAEELKNRSYRFEELCKEILKKSLLPNFYLPHPLEYTIVCSILSGVAVSNTFDGLVYRLKVHSEKAPRHKADEKCEDKHKETLTQETEQASDTEKTKVIVLDSKNQKRINARLLRHAYAMHENHEVLALHNEYAKLLDDFNRIVSAIHFEWKKYDYNEIDVYFEKNGDVGILPRGKFCWNPYKKVTEMCTAVQKLCWNNDRNVLLPVYSDGRWTTVENLIIEFYREQTEKATSEKDAIKQKTDEKYILDSKQLFRARRKMVLYYIWSLLEIKLNGIAFGSQKKDEYVEYKETEPSDLILKKLSDKIELGEKTIKDIQVYARSNLIMKLGSQDYEFERKAHKKQSAYGHNQT